MYTMYKPQGGGAYIWRSDLTEGFFCIMSMRGLHMEGLNLGILWYLIEKDNFIF